MRPKIQKPLRFVRKTKCRVHFPTLAKAVLWYNARTHGGRNMIARRTIFGRGGRDNCSYPAVNIGSEKIMVHVLLMMYRLQGNIPEDMYVHHMDENKANSCRANLALWDISLHQRHHNLGKDCARWRGRKLNYADNVQSVLPVRIEPVLISTGSKSDLPF